MMWNVNMFLYAFPCHLKTFSMITLMQEEIPWCWGSFLEGRGREYALTPQPSATVLTLLLSRAQGNRRVISEKSGIS